MHYYQIVDRGDMGINFFMAFIGLLFIILLIIVIFKLSNYKGAEKPKLDQGPAHNNSVEIAKQRYAKGEINKDEFAQLKKDLAEK